MAYWALTFLVIAVVSGLFALGGWAGAAAREARVLFFIFTALFIFALFLRRRGGATAPAEPGDPSEDDDAPRNERGLPTDRT